MHLASEGIIWGIGWFGMVGLLYAYAKFKAHGRK